MPNNQQSQVNQNTLQQIYDQYQISRVQLGTPQVVFEPTIPNEIPSSQDFYSQPIRFFNDSEGAVPAAQVVAPSPLEGVALSTPKRDECYPRRKKFKIGKKVQLVDPEKIYLGAGYKVKHGDIGIISATYRCNSKEFEVSVNFGSKGNIHFMDKFLRLINEDKKPAWF